MTSAPLTMTSLPNDHGAALSAAVDRSMRRGRAIALLSSAGFAAAILTGGLFVVALIDAVTPMSGWLRGVGLFVALLLSGMFAVRQVRDVFNSARPELGAAQRIDRASKDASQTVVRGVSMLGQQTDDALSLKLGQRACDRAAAVAQTVPPSKAYPLGVLVAFAVLLAGIQVLWLVLTVAVPMGFGAPSQYGGMLTRVALPWLDAPAYTLTGLDPTWEPDPVEFGNDVAVVVEPTGREVQAVALIRLDARGVEAERFEMQALSADGGEPRFRFVLRRVNEPITFRLEAYGRLTRAYTITPTAAESKAPDAGDADAQTPVHNAASEPGDPSAPTTIDPATRAEWNAIRGRIDRLLDDLAEAAARAGSLDASDTEAVAALAAELGELVQRAETLANDLAQLQAELPASAAASLAQLEGDLSQMRSAGLPMPGASQTTAGDPAPTTEDWLAQAGEAAKADQAQIAVGLGASDLATESGSVSGNPDNDGPSIIDPRAVGTSDAIAGSSDEGPLPPAVMQQVPPSYRPLIQAYFTDFDAPPQDNSP